MALCYSWLYLSGQWKHFFISFCSDCQIHRKKNDVASAWPWVSYKSEQEVSKAFIGMCPLHLGDAFNSVSPHWGLSEQCCSCGFAWPCVLLHLVSWLAFDLSHHHGLLWRWLVFSWTLSPSSGSLCSAFIGTIWYHFSVPMPVRVLSFQACFHTQMPDSLPLLSNPLLLLSSDSCQYIFYHKDSHFVITLGWFAKQRIFLLHCFSSVFYSSMIEFLW